MIFLLLLLAIIITAIIIPLICISHKQNIHRIDGQRELEKEYYDVLSKILNTKD